MKKKSTEANYPCLIFLTLSVILEIEAEWQKTFVQDNFVRDRSGFDPIVMYEEFNLPPKRVDVLSFNNFFVETVIAERMTS